MQFQVHQEHLVYRHFFYLFSDALKYSNRGSQNFISYESKVFEGKFQWEKEYNGLLL